jgi:SAM-dependent methyltransferase
MMAKQRAVIEFREGDAETIDLPTASFDAVLCRLGLMFLPDLRAGLSNIYKSLIENGHHATAVWASPDKVSLISLTMETVMKETKSPPPPTGTPRPFSLSDENLLKDSFTKSGFKDINTERMNVAFDFDSAEAYTSFVCETAGPLHAMLANVAQERREEILKAVTKSARNYAESSTSTVKFSNDAICIVGRK